MKTRIPMIVAPALLALSALNPQLSTGFAQGSLTPPGAPAPTMLSLSQIEPRTPVDAAHTGSGGSSEFLITQPGSYYLTTNMVGVSGENGINISANNVTLNLNGFSVQGISGVWSGVYIHAGYTNVTVRNGNISGWGTTSTYSGVECYANNVILEHLNVSADHYGIYLDSSGVVRDCNCHNNTSIGIQVNAGKVSGCETLNNSAAGIYVVAGIVSDCDALTNANSGIYVSSGTVSGCTANNNLILGIYEGLGTVSGCTANNNGFGDGIDVSNNCTVKDCTASGNSENGIRVENNCTIKDCTASGNTYDGIYVETNCTVKDCTVSDNSNGYGIGVYGNDSQIAGNILQRQLLLWHLY